MTVPRSTRDGASPDPTELLSISDRARHLGALRLGLGTVVIAACVLEPTMTTVPVGWITLSTSAYLAVSTAFVAIVGRDRRIALPVLQGGLLLDGIFLAAAVGLTGGASSPLRFLPFVHVVAVTLLCSYRTGLKLTLWHTVLFLWVVQAIDAELLRAAAPTQLSSGSAVAFTIVGMWFLALGTAAFSATSERELRRQKVDLACLSRMVARIDGSRTTAEIPRILLEELCDAFGFVRGVVLASPDGELELLATTDPEPPARPADGMDPLMSRAWSDRAPQLARAIDPASDPRLAGLLPDARNVVVVPMFLDGGHRLGVVAVERGDAGMGMRRWMVDMVEQFAAHATLALYNAWLTEEREAQLDRIRRLEHRLRAHNVELETKVAERTEELHEVIRHLEEVDEQRRNLLEHVVRASEDERRRIANDVHDDPVQKLVVVKMRLEMLKAEHPELTDIDDAEAAVLSTIKSMRRMLFDLSPPVLDEEGIGPALRYFLENSSVPFRWTVDDMLETEPSTQTRLILYRTAQEALANARKHAQAELVRLRLEERDGGVWMEIEDDGVGFRPQEAVVAAPGHLGLAAMRERAEMAGGWCSLRSLPGAGTTLQVWLPGEDVATGSAGTDDPHDRAEEDGADGGLATMLALQDRIA
jgi:signal transduction histidine kinase